MTINQGFSKSEEWLVIGKEDLICFSLQRWNFVYQRPQHLMSRSAQERRVFFVEEAVTGQQKPYLEIQPYTVTTGNDAQIWVVVPHLPEGLSDEHRVAALQILIDGLLISQEIKDYVLWYYTPEALLFTRHLKPHAIVYDCMNELSVFQCTNPQLCALEAELFQRADLVFTSSPSLYEAKSMKHRDTYYFPNSIDLCHFAKARTALPEPDDQKHILHPRLGFFGVLDKQLDIELLAHIAMARPEWQLVLIGPVVGINPEHLPQHENIHYLGAKEYQNLPAYLAGWDVALLPFVLNELSHHISLNKTPQYLAAGKSVVSTATTDVVQVYGEMQLVQIARNADEFVQSIEQCLMEKNAEEIERKRDQFLAEMSWDQTWKQMAMLIDAVTAVVRSGLQVLLISNSVSSLRK